MTYRYVQGIDYGPRSGTRGLSFHMSEGGDGLVGFLSRHPGEDLHQWAARVNGVSCHAALLSTGELVQMLDWTHCSGNLNPDDRAGEYGYYGHQNLVDVLGDGWTNPNEWTLSMEIAGFRAQGPTAAQVNAAIRWGNEMIARFPQLRGATGHHDQSPKPCPGTTANMKAIFEGVGGHGLWTPKEEPMPGLPITNYVAKPGTATVLGNVPPRPDGTVHAAIQLADRELFWFGPGATKPIIGEGIVGVDPAWAGRPVWIVGDDDDTELAAFLKPDVEFTPAPVPPKDCSAEISTAIKADRAKAYVAYKGG